METHYGVTMKMIFLFLLCSFTAFADDYDKIFTRLQDLDNKIPNSTLFTLGKNDQGRDIMGLVIGDAASATVRHLVVGVHHGNERASAEVPLIFIQNMKPAAHEAYFVIPVLNISGYNVSRREETGSDGKTHDANRDYEDACETKVDFQLKSTSLISEFMGRENIVAAVTVHGYIGTFTFPWGMYAKDFATMDDALMRDWAIKTAKINKYKTGTHGDIVYPAAGSFEDWAYLKHGIWSFLMEIKSPSSDLQKDAQALIEFFKTSPQERSRHVGQRPNCAARLLSNKNISRP